MKSIKPKYTVIEASSKLESHNNNLALSISLKHISHFVLLLMKNCFFFPSVILSGILIGKTRQFGMARYSGLGVPFRSWQRHERLTSKTEKELTGAQVSVGLYLDPQGVPNVSGLQLRCLALESDPIIRTLEWAGFNSFVPGNRIRAK